MFDKGLGQKYAFLVSQYLRDVLTPGSVSVITDTNVWALHGDKLRAALSRHYADLNVFVKVLSPGEASKCREIKAEVEDEMLANRFVPSFGRA